MGVEVLEVMPAFIIWLLIAAMVGLIALSRGRNFIRWTIYALLISLLALIHLLCIPRTERGLEREGRLQGRSPCPHCSEHIRSEAKVCPYCRKEVGPAERQPACRAG